MEATMGSFDNKEEWGMPDWKTLTENLEKHGFTVHRFPTKEEAARYIDKTLDGRTIGIGGSMTVKELGLYEFLAGHNEVHWHWTEEGPAAREATMGAQVYLCSTNAVSETGELSTSTGWVTAWPGPFTDMRRSGSWWGKTRSSPMRLPPFTGPGAWPPPSITAG